MREQRLQDFQPDRRRSLVQGITGLVIARLWLMPSSRSPKKAFTAWPRMLKARAFPTSLLIALQKS